jgi:pilus assembly protein TadC
VTGAGIAAALLAGAAMLPVGDARRVARSRMRSLTPSWDSDHPVPPAPVPPVAAAALAAAALLVAMLALGPGPVVAGAVPVVVLLLGRASARRSATRRRRHEIETALPRFADLLAACLESGAAPADALDVVRSQLTGPLAVRLAPVAGALRTGVDPVAVYGDHGRDDPVRALVAALARALESGTALADAVSTVADEQRRRRRWAAEAAARRAGVHAVGPLVVCFLPAFVLLGVVPVVLGIATEVLRDLG